MTTLRIIISNRKMWMIFALAVFQIHLIMAEPTLIFNLREENIHRYTEDKIFITCSPPKRATPTYINMQWINPKQEQITATTGRVRVEKNKNNGLDLMFEKIEVSDKGVYKCTAKVEGRMISRNFTLHVSVPISFAETEPVQWVVENTNNSINCTVGGVPMPSITWRSRDHDMKDHRYRPEQEKLFISNIRRSDAGEYVCKAMQSTQEITSFNETIITLKIKFKPEWTKVYNTDEEVFGFIDGKTNMTCEANGEPEPKFQWSKNENAIDTDDFTESGIDNHVIFAEPNRSVLQIDIGGEDNFGNYQCTVTNPMGRIQRTIILKKIEKPQPPTIKLKHQQHDRVEVELTTSEDSSNVIGYQVEYRLGKDDWEKASFDNFSKDEPVVLTQLEQNETYLMRVRTKNKAGYGESSEEFQFQTLQFRPASVSGGRDGTNGCASSGSLMAVLISAFCRLAIVMYNV